MRMDLSAGDFWGERASRIGVMDLRKLVTEITLVPIPLWLHSNGGHRQAKARRRCVPASN